MRKMYHLVTLRYGWKIRKIFRKISEYFYVNACISVKKVVYLYSWKKGRRQAPVQGTEANKREF